MRSTSRPALKTSSVGMLSTSNRAAVAGFSSMLSLAKRTRPAIDAASSSTIGAIWRQGPHQGAQRSSSTGNGDFSTCVEKLASVTTIGLVETLRRALHRPQTGVSPSWIFTRFVESQLKQRMRIGSDISGPLTQKWFESLRHGQLHIIDVAPSPAFT